MTTRSFRPARTLIFLVLGGLAVPAFVPMSPAAAPSLTNFAACVLSDGRVQVSWVSDVPTATGVLETPAGAAFRKIAESPQKELRNHRVFADGWQPGIRRIRVRAPDSAGLEYVSTCVDIEIPAAAPRRPAREQTLSLIAASAPLPERASVAGVPFASGQLWQAEDAWVEAGRQPLPAQMTVSSRWPDKSIRWLLARFQAPAATADLQLRLGLRPRPAPNPFEIRQMPDGLAIANGLLHLGFRKNHFALFGEVTDGGSMNWSGPSLLADVRVTDGNGATFGLGPPDWLEVEENGPVQAVVRAEGPFRSEAGANYFRYRLRYSLAAHSPLVRVQLTFVNDRIEPDFQPLTSIDFRIPLSGDGPLRGQLAGGGPVGVESSRKNAIQQVTDHRLRRTTDGLTTQRDERSPGWAVLERGPARLAFVFRDFWQTWPKAIALEPDGIDLQVLPPLAQNEYAAHDLQDWLKHYYWFSQGKYLLKRGMALRVDFQVRFGRTSEPVPSGGWETWARAVQSPPYAATAPEHYCSSGAFGPVLPAKATADAGYETMVERAEVSMTRGREEAGEYGWMNFGDWYGERRFNWGNNEYDWPWAMGQHFVRSGRWDYLLSGELMARHSSTIDAVRIPWTSGMAGRAYIHCVGHVGMSSEPPLFEERNAAWEKFRETSRGFVRGGIDSSGHIFEEGKFAMYLLTGDRDMLEAAENSAGAQAAFLTPQFDFHIERGAGWPLINAVAAYEATGNPFYLNAARLYVARILEKQDAHNGGWMLPQDPKECSHPPPHLGGKPFATGVLLYGMMRYDLVEPRPEVKRSIVRACDWLVQEGWNAGKRGFRYKTGCSDYADSADSGGCMALCCAGLGYGWTLSGDQRFAEVLSTGFERMCTNSANLGKGSTMTVRQSAYALPVLQQIQAAAKRPANPSASNK